MPKGYDKLKFDEICIYQAFSAATGMGEKTLADAVNAQGIDADDGAAVVWLAKTYGYDRVEVVEAAHFVDGTYRLDNDAKVVAIITRSNAVRVQAGKWRMLTEWGIRASADPRRRLTETSLDNESWHAIFGATNASSAVTWTDKQAIYPAGPNGQSIALFFIKK